MGWSAMASMSRARTTLDRWPERMRSTAVATARMCAGALTSPSAQRIPEGAVGGPSRVRCRVWRGFFFWVGEGRGRGGGGSPGGGGEGGGGGGAGGGGG